MGNDGTQWTLNQALDEAAAEWTMQAALPDDEPKGMSENARDAYLQARLIHCLMNILIVSGKLKELHHD